MLDNKRTLHSVRPNYSALLILHLLRKYENYAGSKIKLIRIISRVIILVLIHISLLWLLLYGFGVFTLDAVLVTDTYLLMLGLIIYLLYLFIITDLSKKNLKAYLHSIAYNFNQDAIEVSYDTHYELHPVFWYNQRQLEGVLEFPYEKIEEVHITRSFLDFFFGTSSLTLVLREEWGESDYTLRYIDDVHYVISLIEPLISDAKKEIIYT